MGHKPVDSPHHKMVGQILFQLHAFRPSVVSENLAHGSAFFHRLYGCRAGRQPPQRIVVKYAVSDTVFITVFAVVLHLRHHLSADIVNPRHILSRKPPEKMPQAGTASGMLVIVLNHVSDVGHAPGTAPVAQLTGKVLFHTPCHHVHKIVAHSGFQPSLKFPVPQKRQIFPIAAAPSLLKLRLYLPAKGLVRNLLQGFSRLINMAVSQLRLVREKSRYGLSEFFLIMSVVGLVNGLNQLMDRFGVAHIHIISVRASVSGKMAGVKRPFALRRTKKNPAALFLKSLLRANLSVKRQNILRPSSALLHCHNAQKHIVVKDFRVGKHCGFVGVGHKRLRLFAEGFIQYDFLSAFRLSHNLISYALSA